MRPGQRQKEMYTEIRLRVRKDSAEAYLTCRPTGDNWEGNHRCTSGTMYWCVTHSHHVCAKHWTAHERELIMEALSK